MHQAASPHETVGVVMGWFLEPGEADQKLATVQSLTPPPGGAVLEVGFGAGHALQMLARHSRPGLMAGVDTSELMVRTARRRLAQEPGTMGLDLRCGEADRLPFADDSFDVVYAVNAYRQWRDPPGGLAEMAGVLKPGGDLVLSIRDFRVQGEQEAPGAGLRTVCEAVAELGRLGLQAEVEEIIHSAARATFLVRARKAKL